MHRHSRVFFQLRKLSTKMTETTKTTAKINPYLYFNGNCAEARDFYAAKFNGQSPCTMFFKDVPNCDLPEERKGWISHSVVSFGDNHIMMCDDPKAENYTVGSNVTLCVNYDDVDEMTAIWNGMTEGAEIQMPLAKQFWQSTYGKLKDKFGVIWAFNCHHKDADGSYVKKD